MSTSRLLNVLNKILDSKLFISAIEIVDSKEGFYLRTKDTARNLMIMWPTGRDGIDYISIEKNRNVVTVSIPALIDLGDFIQSSESRSFVHTLYRIESQDIKKIVMARPKIEGQVETEVNDKGIYSYLMELKEKDLDFLEELLSITRGQLELRQENRQN